MTKTASYLAIPKLATKKKICQYKNLVISLTYKYINVIIHECISQSDLGKLPDGAHSTSYISFSMVLFIFFFSISRRLRKMIGDVLRIVVKLSS